MIDSSTGSVESEPVIHQMPKSSIPVANTYTVASYQANKSNKEVLVIIYQVVQLLTKRL